jgi:hypothetical protein
VAQALLDCPHASLPVAPQPRLTGTAAAADAALGDALACLRAGGDWLQRVEAAAAAAEAAAALLRGMAPGESGGDDGGGDDGSAGNSAAPPKKEGVHGGSHGNDEPGKDCQGRCSEDNGSAGGAAADGNFVLADARGGATSVPSGGACAAVSAATSASHRLRRLVAYGRRLQEVIRTETSYVTRLRVLRERLAVPVQRLIARERNADHEWASALLAPLLPELCHRVPSGLRDAVLAPWAEEIDQLFQAHFSIAEHWNNPKVRGGEGWGAEGRPCEEAG